MQINRGNSPAFGCGDCTAAAKKLLRIEQSTHPMAKHLKKNIKTMDEAMAEVAHNVITDTYLYSKNGKPMTHEEVAKDYDNGLGDFLNSIA